MSRISRQATGTDGQLEAGAVEEFNLDQFLNGMAQDSANAGQKPKHLGVIWKDLTVEVSILVYCYARQYKYTNMHVTFERVLVLMHILFLLF